MCSLGHHLSVVNSSHLIASAHPSTCSWHLSQFLVSNNCVSGCEGQPNMETCCGPAHVMPQILDLGLLQQRSGTMTCSHDNQMLSLACLALLLACSIDAAETRWCSKNKQQVPLVVLQVGLNFSICLCTSLLLVSTSWSGIGMMPYACIRVPAFKHECVFLTRNNSWQAIAYLQMQSFDVRGIITPLNTDVHEMARRFKPFPFRFFTNNIVCFRVK